MQGCADAGMRSAGLRRRCDLAASPLPNHAPQVACKAQKASVEPEEVARYQAYNERHGAKLAAGGGGEAGDDEDDW